MLDGLNRFTYNPTSVSTTRSRFDRSHGHKTTFDSGRLIPIMVDEVLPGDTVSLDTSAVVRMTTPIHPVMDNAFLDIYYFFVPMRLVWDHAKEFFGENTTGPWAQQAEYAIPQVSLRDVVPGCIADYFGLPFTEVGVSNSRYYVNALPFRSYALIWNEYFRDQNVSTPIPIEKGENVQYLSGSNIDSAWYVLGKPNNRPETGFFGATNFPLPVAKFHDLFTSCLPEPQKGPAVTLPLVGTQFDGLIPVGTSDSMHNVNTINNADLLWHEIGNYTSNSGSLMFNANTGSTYISSGSVSSTVDSVVPGNLYADVSGVAATINAFRQALALQGLYELDARGGTRYREIIKSHFGVTSPDARMQIPEFLHGKRIPITMQQVVQTSASDSTSPQGNTAAFSLTQDAGNSFTYSATEHGYIMGLACVRTSLTYQQRIEKMWSRRRRFDFYWPVFANLGEQPIYNKELYFDTAVSGDNSGATYNPDNPGTNVGEAVFGFNEAWAEYRFRPSQITGKFRSNAEGTLDVWHYAQDFTSQPRLSPEFIMQPQEVIDRTIAVQDEPQFLGDFYFKATWVRPMPMYSVPALLGRM